MDKRTYTLTEKSKPETMQHDRPRLMSVNLKSNWPSLQEMEDRYKEEEAYLTQMEVQRLSETSKRAAIDEYVFQAAAKEGYTILNVAELEACLGLGPRKTPLQLWLENSPEYPALPFQQPELQLRKDVDNYWPIEMRTPQAAREMLLKILQYLHEKGINQEDDVIGQALAQDLTMKIQPHRTKTIIDKMVQQVGKGTRVSYLTGEPLRKNQGVPAPRVLEHKCKELSYPQLFIGMTLGWYYEEDGSKWVFDPDSPTKYHQNP